MQIEKILMPHEIIKDKEMPMNSIVLRLDNKMILVCSKFNHSRKQKLELLVWLPTENKWVRTYAKNEYTEMMCDYHVKTERKHKKNYINYAQMMKHSRVHKASGGGSRIFDGSITDYECRKEPLNDFRRSFYI